MLASGLIALEFSPILSLMLLPWTSTRHHIEASSSQHFTTRIRIPLLGRKVILGSGTIVCPDTNVNLNRCAIEANTKMPSILANDSPMQTRAPPPNGKYATSHSSAYRKLGPSDGLQEALASMCHRHQLSPQENCSFKFP